MEPGATTTPSRDSNSSFATTHWTRVMAARGGSSEAKAALNELCEAYYAPVVRFLRCSGGTEEQAREQAHEFFARLLERSGLDRLERGHGRFRSYLLGALKHSLLDISKRERAAKRGAGRETLALEPGSDSSPGVDPVDTRMRTPEEEFDRQWAMTLLDRALAKLEDEHKRAGKQSEFEALKPSLTGDAPHASQAEIAVRLSMNQGAVKVAIHRLRKRFRELVKVEIAQTVADPDQVAEELRSLIAALR